jgi:hypothetical protein
MDVWLCSALSIIVLPIIPTFLGFLTFVTLYHADKTDEKNKDTEGERNTRVYPKVSGLSHDEIHAYNNKHSLRSNTKGYSGKTH